MRLGHFVAAVCAFAFTVAVCTCTAARVPPNAEVPGQLPQIGNGFIATFVNSSTEYVGGIFSGANIHSTRAGLPATTRLFAECALPALQRPFPLLLDTRGGLVDFAAVGCGTAGATWSQRWYAPRDHRNLLVTQGSLFAPHSEGVVAFSVVEPDTVAADYPHIEVTHTQSTSPTMQTSVYRTRVAETPSASTQRIAVARYSSVAGRHVATCNCTMYNVPTCLTGTNSVQGTFTRISATVTSLEYPGYSDAQLAAAAERLIENALLGGGTEQLLARHVQAWQQLWAHGVTTDSLSSAAALDASQYAILSAVRADWPFSTSPGGLATDGYNGHTFWDMETWVNPNLVLLHPDVAFGSGFRYRLDRLAGARVNAAVTLGQKGAAFPWESAFTGENVCPAPLFAHTELHVTADVMLATRQYARLLPPRERLAFLNLSWPMLNETARFWASRTTAEDGGTGLVHLKNVTGPDEYHLGDDSVFTNYAVQSAIQFVLDAGSALGRLGDVSDVLVPLQRIASNMTILYNATADYHPEFAGYAGQPVKQADVILLNYPLMMPMAASTATNDLNYYANRTSPNKSGASTMTWSMFAVGYFSVLDPVKGNQYFKMGFERNCFPPYYQWYQAVGGHGNDNFITGAGGFVQSFWAGFLSLRVVDAGLQVAPATFVLPDDGTFVSMTGVHVHGALLDLKLSAVPGYGLLLNITQTFVAADGPMCVTNVINTPGAVPQTVCLTPPSPTVTIQQAPYAGDRNSTVTIGLYQAA